MAPITNSRCLVCPMGRIDQYESFQPENTATRVTLEAKNMPLNTPQTWEFQAKNDPLQRLFCTHCTSGMPPITTVRCLTFPPALIVPYEPLHIEISATWVTLEAKSMPLISPQTWEFLTKMTLPETILDPPSMHYCPHCLTEVLSMRA